MSSSAPFNDTRICGDRHILSPVVKSQIIELLSHWQASLTLITHYMQVAPKRWLLQSLFMWQQIHYAQHWPHKQECSNMTSKDVFSWVECVSIWNKFTAVSLNMGQRAVMNWRSRSSVLKMCLLPAVPQGSQVLTRATHKIQSASWNVCTMWWCRRQHRIDAL